MNKQTIIKQLQGSLAGSALAGSALIGSVVVGSAMESAPGNPGEITDDTQMALFTAEGLILSKVRSDYLNSKSISEPVYHSLLRWLYTQHANLLGGMIKEYGSCSIVDGILMGNKELFAMRDPSSTCLKALSAGKMGTFEYPPNNSSGPGAIARNLPVGLAIQEPDHSFQTGCECAALTHGHPSAYLASGFYSCLISEIIQNHSLEKSLENTISLLKNQKGHEDILEIVYLAKNLSMRMDPSSLSMQEFFPDRSALHVLGAGIFFALAFGSDFKNCLQAAAKRSITTESCEIAGAIMGAIHGIDTIPDNWLSSLEMNSVIMEIAEDLFNHFHNLQT